MRIAKLCCLIIFLGTLFFSFLPSIIYAKKTSAATDSTLSWLAVGDLRGYLEPCGCDPLTDLGGLRRIGAYVNRERGLRPQTALFFLGNSLVPHSPLTQSLASLKDPFLFEGVALLRPTAALFGQTEIQFALEGSKPKTPTLGQTNYVVSNLTSTSPIRNWASEHVGSQSYIVFGYVYQKDADISAQLKQFDREMSEKWKKTLASINVERRKNQVLLFSGSDADLQAIVETNLFDIIISGNQKSLETQPGTEEKENPSTLRRIITNQSSHEILMTPLGGQGLLRGGAARKSEAKPIAEIFASKAPATPGAASAFTTTAQNPLPTMQIAADFVTWLDKSQGESPEMKLFFERYADASKKNFKDQAKQRLLDLAKTPYVGAEACATCHPKAYSTWKSSGHASAYMTLKEKGKNLDGECVSCHVLGAKEFGGFVSLEASPQFAGVQCETCHGPRKEHSENPTLKNQSSPSALPAPPASQVCTSCHVNPHSSRFQFNSYWPRIQHGK